MHCDATVVSDAILRRVNLEMIILNILYQERCTQFCCSSWWTNCEQPATWTHQGAHWNSTKVHRQKVVSHQQKEPKPWCWSSWGGWYVIIINYCHKNQQQTVHKIHSKQKIYININKLKFLIWINLWPKTKFVFQSDYHPLPPFPPFLFPEWFVDSNAKLEKKKVYMHIGWKRDWIS